MSAARRTGGARVRQRAAPALSEGEPTLRVAASREKRAASGTAASGSANSLATSARPASGSSSRGDHRHTAPAMMYSAIGSELSNVCSSQTASSGAGPPATTDASW